jgi:DNA polymerase (family 10)
VSKTRPSTAELTERHDAQASAAADCVVLGAAIEMARLTNEALARAGFERATVVGDARRGVETMNELSMVARGPLDMKALAAALRGATACNDVEADGRNGLRMYFEGGGPARLRVVPADHYLEAVVRGTGSASHVRWLESLAKRAGGLARVCARAKNERQLYESLGVPFAPPELREQPTPRVPRLVRGVRGIFHVHTTWSDGTGSIAEMAQAATDAGFAYLGISEHSRAASYAHGLDGKRLRAQARAVDEVRREVPEIVLFHGIEVDVLPDGSLDLDDATLAQLDFVVASVHTDLEMPPSVMTERLVRAVTHPLVTILGHPTGRLLPGRRGYVFDVDAVARAAAENDTFLEINANPQRLDLSAALVRRAAAQGARFAIDPDAHSPRGVADTALGLAVARRAGLASSQVLNAKDAAAAAEYLIARRRKAKSRLGRR